MTKFRVGDFDVKAKKKEFLPYWVQQSKFKSSDWKQFTFNNAWDSTEIEFVKKFGIEGFSSLWENEQVRHVVWSINKHENEHINFLRPEKKFLTWIG